MIAIKIFCALFLVLSATQGIEPMVVAPTPMEPSPTPLRVPFPGPVETASQPAAAALPAQSPGPKPSPVLDRSQMLFGPQWSCVTFDGTRLRHDFRPEGNGSSFDVTTYYQRSKETHERYRFDRIQARWLASIAKSTIVVAGPPWDGDTWTLEGTSFDRGRRTGIRMIYSYLGPDAFRRDFERANEFGSWDVYAGETCRRTVRNSE